MRKAPQREQQQTCFCRGRDVDHHRRRIEKPGLVGLEDQLQASCGVDLECSRAGDHTIGCLQGQQPARARQLTDQPPDTNGFADHHFVGGVDGLHKPWRPQRRPCPGALHAAPLERRAAVLDVCRYTDGQCTSRHVAQHNGIGAADGPITDAHRTQDLGASTVCPVTQVATGALKPHGGSFACPRLPRCPCAKGRIFRHRRCLRHPACAGRTRLCPGVCPEADSNCPRAAERLRTGRIHLPGFCVHHVKRPDTPCSRLTCGRSSPGQNPSS